MVSPHFPRSLRPHRESLAPTTSSQVTCGILLAYVLGLVSEEPQLTRVRCGFDSTIDGEIEWTTSMGRTPRVAGRACSDLVSSWTCEESTSSCMGPLPAWRLLAWVACGISAVLLVAMSTVQETPVFLEAAAKRARSAGPICTNPWWALWRGLVGQPAVLRRPLGVGLALMFFQQFSGINAIIFFSGSILEESGLSNPNLGGVIVMSVQVLCTVGAVLVMERLPRTTLLCISSSTLSLSALCFAAFFANGKEPDWLAMVSLIAYVSAFSLGLGPIPWIVMGEIFPADVRSTACGVATLFNWGTGFFVAIFFGAALRTCGPAQVFGFFAAIAVGCAVFVVTAMPETKGKPLEATAREVQRGGSLWGKMKPPPQLQVSDGAAAGMC